MNKSIFLLLIFLSCQASASPTRCDCSKIAGECLSSVSLKSGWITTRSNVNQCSRVDYTIDGEPAVTVVTDGVATEQWLGRNSAPKIAIESCLICDDRNIQSSSSNSCDPRSDKYMLGKVISEQGTQIVPACNACHGRSLQGSSAMGVPALVGEQRTRAALDAYANGTRRDNVMFVMEVNSRALNAHQRDAISYYVGCINP